MGILWHLDLAFSRDQAERLYVQDRMRERSRELYDWLEQGAHVYVCGEADAMARGVHETLVDIVGKEGAKTREAALDYVNALRVSRRYQRDVY